MKREKIIASAMSVAMLMSLFPNLSYASEVKGQAERYYGINRYLTSVEISKKGFEKSRVAIVASGDDYADALCAAPLAKKFDAPILLVSKNEIKKEVLDEIKRLGVEEVYIVGGSGAVSDAVKTKI
ncbi:MAG: cell wall-binding repeat-containing protein, partial [Clostridiales bacterium]|nr:cell wall-binding repeat-containing protein [Clostridiales bacterium]